MRPIWRSVWNGEKQPQHARSGYALWGGMALTAAACKFPYVLRIQLQQRWGHVVCLSLFAATPLWLQRLSKCRLPSQQKE
jgi:hypothetical protein